MKIVVLDSHPFDSDGAVDWSALRSLGDLTLHPGTAPEETTARVAVADVVLTNKVPLRAEHLDAAPRLRLVSVLATGFDVVDARAARERGITVCNVPGYSTPSTAQTTIALLLELCSHVGHHAARVREGAWQRAGVWSFWERTPLELDGLTLAVVGMGAVGTRVARVAEALGMRVLAAALAGRPGPGSGPYPRVPLAEALARADVVSLHCPLTAQTRGLMNAGRIAAMKRGALLVNAGRGPLVDDEAVADALRSGHLAGYAADVLTTEPPAADNPLLTAPNCLISPHFAWTSRASRQRLMDASVENVRAFVAGSPQNDVNGN